MTTAERVVWKYPVPLMPEFELRMPVGAELLHVGMQHDHGQLWALVDPEDLVEVRRFELVATGQELAATPDRHHVGTIITDGGLVFHLFEPLG